MLKLIAVLIIFGIAQGSILRPPALKRNQILESTEEFNEDNILQAIHRYIDENLADIKTKYKNDDVSNDYAPMTKRAVKEWNKVANTITEHSNEEIKAGELVSKGKTAEALGEQSTKRYEVSMGKDLSSDLDDFLELIDAQTLLMILLEYLPEPEVIDLVGFIFSQEFKDMAVEFEAMPEFKEVVLFLTSEGYDVTPYLSMIHEILGLPPYQRTSPPAAYIPQTPELADGLKLDRDYDIPRSVSDLIESILVALPAEELKSLFYEKLATSSEFYQLYKTLTSEEFNDIVTRMTANSVFVKDKTRLEELGVDFAYISKVIAQIFSFLKQKY